MYIAESFIVTQLDFMLQLVSTSHGSLASYRETNFQIKFPDSLVKHFQIVNNSWPAKILSNIINLFQICVSCLYQRCDQTLAKLYCTATAALGLTSFLLSHSLLSARTHIYRIVKLGTNFVVYFQLNCKCYTWSALDRQSFTNLFTFPPHFKQTHLYL